MYSTIISVYLFVLSVVKKTRFLFTLGASSLQFEACVSNLYKVSFVRLPLLGNPHSSALTSQAWNVYCRLLYCTVGDCNIMYCSIVCSVVYSTVIYSTVLYCSTVYRTVIHSNLLYDDTGMQS